MPVSYYHPRILRTSERCGPPQTLRFLFRRIDSSYWRELSYLALALSSQCYSADSYALELATPASTAINLEKSSRSGLSGKLEPRCKVLLGARELPAEKADKQLEAAREPEDSEDRLRLRQEANATSASGRVQSFRRTAYLIRRSTIRAACLKANSRTSRSGESDITSQRLVIIRQPLPECTAPLRSLARPFPLSNREPLSRASVQWRARSSGCISSEPGISQRSYSPLAGSQHGHAVTKNGVDRTKIALWLGLSPWKALRCMSTPTSTSRFRNTGWRRLSP
jgi:hypothetical protein